MFGNPTTKHSSSCLIYCANIRCCISPKFLCTALNKHKWFWWFRCQICKMFTIYQFFFYTQIINYFVEVLEDSMTPFTWGWGSQDHNVNNYFDSCISCTHIGFLQINLAGEFFANLVQSARGPITKPVEDAPTITPRNVRQLANRILETKRNKRVVFCLRKHGNAEINLV